MKVEAAIWSIAFSLMVIAVCEVCIYQMEKEYLEAPVCVPIEQEEVFI